MRSSAKFLFLLCALAAAGSAQDIPHLVKQGTATQLIVDGKPFLALAGELDNDASTDLDNLGPLWPMLVRMNLNTVLPPAYWELVEPEEGKFDFTLIDGMLQEARRHNLRLMLLWFASWKNGMSNYAPLWAKKDTQRFPRVQTRTGADLEMFSSIEGYGDATRDADARAFAALLRHLKAVDGQQHTVIMIQVENEMGVLGDSRDRSPAANKGLKLTTRTQFVLGWVQWSRDLRQFAGVYLSFHCGGQSKLEITAKWFGQRHGASSCENLRSLRPFHSSKVKLSGELLGLAAC